MLVTLISKGNEYEDCSNSSTVIFLRLVLSSYLINVFDRQCHLNSNNLSISLHYYHHVCMNISNVSAYSQYFLFV